VRYDAVIVGDEQPGKRPTLQDVARLAGVSHQTVSRAINNKGEIDPDTRRRVLDAARQLNYRPSRFARGLVRPDTTTIGLLVPDVVNPFFPELIAGVLDAARKRDWQVVIASAQDDHAREPELLRSLSTQVDALICYLFPPDDVIAAAVGGVPLVVMSRRSAEPSFGAVDIDSESGIRAAVHYLKTQGHQKIGMIDSSWAADRIRRVEFLTAAADNGLTIPADAIADAELSLAGGESAFAGLHARRPDLTALFTYNDQIAMGAHRAARRLGLEIPRDIALIGFDGLSLGELIDPPLTTVHLDKRRMGELAVAQVASLLAGDHPPPAVLPTNLLLRGSA